MSPRVSCYGHSEVYRPAGEAETWWVEVVVTVGRGSVGVLCTPM